jgi:GNAT superfamily N-acetyltransferase
VVLHIERINSDGWRVYRDLRLASLGDAPYAFGSRLETERERGEAEWRERLADRTQFVALAEGRPVGTVGARSEGESETELVSMWVEPGWRHSGVGGRLVAAVIEEARARGSVSVVLWVSRGNEPAERLFAQHGFVRTGRTQAIDEDDPARGTELEMRLLTAGP